MNEPALSGVKIVAFTHFAAGPIAAQYLGALGADVVKVEAPALDANRYAVRDPDGLLQGISPYFLVTNRNQRCLGLNLKSPDGLEAARRLIARSDIVVENYRPGVMDRLGLGYEHVRAINGRIVYCSISAYDPQGPKRNAAGQDLLIQAVSGLASLTGREGGPPVPTGVYVIDGFTALNAVIGILAALRYRDLYDVGQWVRCDMMSATLYMMAQEASYTMNVKEPTRSRSAIAHADQSAPYGIYETADGAVAISTFGGVPVVGKLADALELQPELEPHLTARGLRTDRDFIADAITRRVRLLTSQQVIDRLAPTGAWAVRVQSLPDALKDSAIAATDLIREVTTPYGGNYRVVIEPLRLSKSPLIFSQPAPAEGEHTEQVLSELGYAPSESRRLIAQGAAYTVATRPAGP